jgi:hypothetical protein
MGQIVMGQVGQMQSMSSGLVPASAPIALATAASGGAMQGHLNPALLNMMQNMQLQQQQQGVRTQMQQVS